MPSKESVREEIVCDECVAQKDELFICFWHQKTEAVQWLESGSSGLAQLEQQKKVFADQGLEVHKIIWATTELRGSHYVIEFHSFGPTGDSAVESPDIVALALADQVIQRRYVYAVCHRVESLSKDRQHELLCKVSTKPSYNEPSVGGKGKSVGAKVVEEEKAENLSHCWRWSQTESDLEVLVTLPEGTSKAAVNVSIGRSSLNVSLKADSANPILDIKKLFYPISSDGSAWVMGSDAKGPHVQVTLEKEQEQTWPNLESKRK